VGGRAALPASRTDPAPGHVPVAGIGIAVNLYIGFGLHKEGSNLNVRAAVLHVFGDVGASAGVIVAGLVILFTGWTPVDPLLSIGIAGLIVCITLGRKED
jgi:Co/Zn/Cd efflux system component